jgi:hypothetical protein
MELMKKMSQEDGVKFDSREGFYSKIERDWLPQDDNDGGVLGEIIEYVDQKVDIQLGKMGEPGLNPDEKKEVPIILKLLYYIMFNAGDTAEGIAKVYYGDPGQPEWEGEDSKKKSVVDESVSYEQGKFGGSGSWFNYDFMSPVHGFLKKMGGRFPVGHMLWLDKSVTGDDNTGGRMAAGVTDNLVSVLYAKKQQRGRKPQQGNDPLVYHEWQDPNRAYNYLKSATYVKPIFKEGVRQEMLRVAMLRANGQEPLRKDEWMEIVRKKIKTMYAGEWDDDIFDRTFEKHYKTFVMKEGEGFKGTMAGNINPKMKVFIDKDDKFFLMQGGKKKRKKRTRRKRKKKRKRTRKRKKRNCKKRMKKKIICLSAPNKKATRKLIRVTKKLARMKGIKLSKCSKQRIKKWTKRKKRTRRRRKR